MNVRSLDLCNRCVFRFGGPICVNRTCDDCEMMNAENGMCRCDEVRVGTPCPSFKEDDNA